MALRKASFGCLRSASGQSTLAPRATEVLGEPYASAVPDHAGIRRLTLSDLSQEALIHMSGELVTPAAHREVEALALAWHREIQRNFGISKFEGED